MTTDILRNIKFSSLMSGVGLDAKGASSGLLTLYNSKHFRVEVVYNEGNILLFDVHHIRPNKNWFLLNLYASNKKRERKNYWTKVGNLMQSSNLKKGIIMGDFNTPLQDGEKKGGLLPK